MEEDKNPPKSIATYGKVTAFAVAVNYIIGAGVFGLPYAFYKAGIPLTIITLVFFAFFLVLLAGWVLEVISRVQGWTDYCSSSTRSSNSVESVTTSVNTAMSDEGSSQPLLAHLKPINHIGFEVISYTRFSKVFGGRKGMIVTQIMIALYSLGSLWAYVATVGSSVAMLGFEFFVKNETCNIYHDPSPKCQQTYYLSVLAFAIIAVPLSLLAIAEQRILQVLLTAYRFIAFGVMLVSVIVAWAIGGPIPRNVSSSLASFDELSSSSDNMSIWNFKWAGFGLMFPSAALALNLHWNIPDVVAPAKDKKPMKVVLASAQIVSLIFYILIGGVCAIYFDPPDPLVTLNWGSYTGHQGGWGAGNQLWWAKVVELVIVCFPILNLINVFPLVAVSLASNVEALFPDVEKPQPHGKVFSFFFGSSADSRHRHMIIRFYCCIPPLVLGALLGKLDVIFTISGMFGFILEFIVPTVFHMISSNFLVKRFGAGSDVTPYTNWSSNKFWVLLTLIIGSIACITAIVFTGIGWAS